MVSSNGVRWGERLKGFLILVPPVCIMMMFYWTRIVLGVALLCNLFDEYYNVVETSFADVNRSVSQRKHVAVQMCLASLCFICAHYSVTCLLGAFTLTILVCTHTFFSYDIV